MACRVAASKRISLNNDDDMLEVGENLKDVVSFHEFKPVMGKHPDLMVAHPTSTIFPTIGRNFEIS